MRIRNATMMLWLLAAACGGQGGGEESMSREEIAMETPDVSPEAMPETQSVAQAGGAATEPMAPPEGPPQERTSCPADLEGLEVSVASMPRGGALVFRADDEDALRARLRLFAKMHEAQRIEEAGGPPPVEKPEATASAEAMTAPAGPVQPKLEQNPEEQRFADADALIHQASEVRMVETAQGARLEVQFEEGAQLRALRAELRADAEQLAAGTCPLALSIQS